MAKFVLFYRQLPFFMRKILILFFLICTGILSGQEVNFDFPVKIPVYLSGSFGELRSNHFHSGIDIKTQGVKRIPVFSAAEGYISRISVSPTGYGKVLYVNHPGGTTTVYGHLDDFREDIKNYVKEIQYSEKSFQVNLIPDSALFPLKKGDFIALSGNSGSSGGPHLHFEVRDTQTEEPLNPLKSGFTIRDGIAPVIRSLLIVPLSADAHVEGKREKKTYRVEFSNGVYRITGNVPVGVAGQIGIAVEANDYFDDSSNPCGINLLEMSVDGERRFLFDIDRFSFDHSRFINSYIDYETYILQHKRYQKTWIDEGTRWKNYRYAFKKGVITVNHSGESLIHIRMTDSHGNNSVLELKLKGSPANLPFIENKFDRLFSPAQGDHWETDSFAISFGKNTFYTNVPFTYTQKTALPGLFSGLHVVHKNTVPLHKPVKIRMITAGLPERHREKALLVSVDTVSGKKNPAGGFYREGWVEGEIRNFGCYAVAVDTISPKIVPLSIKNNKQLLENSQIRFMITDDLSGIASIEGLLDGQWILFEYDPKNQLITHQFDKDRYTLEKNHQFVLKVTDEKGNTTSYEAAFYR